MEYKKQKTIYINAEDEIGFIIDNIKKCKEKEIVLVLPENAMIFQELINLRILKMNAKELGKNISMVTVDDGEHARIKNKIRETGGLKDENKPGSIKDLFDESGVEEENKKEFSFNNLDEDKPDGDLGSKIKIQDIVKKEKTTKTTDNGQNNQRDKTKETSVIREEEQEQGITENKSVEQYFNIDGPESYSESAKKQNKKMNLLPTLSARFFVGFIIIGTMIVSSVLIFVLPKADIIAVLRPDILAYNFEFIADETVEEINTVSNKIPSEKISIEKEETGSYPTTGKKHVRENAVGKITVYNECSTGPQILVANTRFLSKEGKIFKIKEQITINGFTKPEDKVISGSVEAEVVAEGPGESYNINGTSFTIPKLQETNSWKFSCLYARSESPMSGGIDKEVLYFSDSDYLTAKEKLLSVAIEKSKKELSEKISNEYILVESLEQKEEIKTGSDIKVNDVTDNFQMTVILKSEVILAARKDIDNLINEKINSDLDQNIELVEGSREYEIGEIRKKGNDENLIPVSASQKAIAKINLDKIKEEIAGKNETELREYFAGTRGINEVNVSFWPFWVSKIPSSSGKINITIDINNAL